MIHHWKAQLCSDLLLESAKKLANLQNLYFYFAKSSYIVKYFSKINCPKILLKIHFLKALHHALSNMQKMLQNFQ